MAYKMGMRRVWSTPGRVSLEWYALLIMVNISRSPVQTPDALPFVGDIPGKKGQDVAAGYNGPGEFV